MSVYDRFRHNVSRLFVKPDDFNGRVLHATVGVSGEGGELLDAAKKAWVYGAPLDTENVKEECGDCLFYLQALLMEIGSSIEEAMEMNITKLNKRYPEGYTDQAAIERADKAEEST